MSEYDVEDFQREVIERSRSIPVVVDFWAEWCGPCKALGPVLERLAAEAGDDWVLAKVDTEVHREPAAEYGIRSIPNVKLFVDGRPVNEFVGALPEPQVRDWLTQALPSPSADGLRAAAELLKSGAGSASADAVVLLEEILESEPDNAEARVLLAWATLFVDPNGAAKVLEPISAGSLLADRVGALRTLARLLSLAPDGADLGESPAKRAYLDAIAALAERRYEAALNGFIDVVGRDRELDGDGARAACLAIFEILGADTVVTREGRRALANVLFA